LSDKTSDKIESAPLEFWFEFASTYSYVAAMRIGDLAARAGIALAWKPFLLGPIFQAQGWNDSPFNLYPVKGRYMWRDMERLCARHGIAFAKPARFPQRSILAARVALALEHEPGYATEGPAFVRAAYRANFAEGRNIGEHAVVEAALREAGLAPEHWIARAETMKDALRAQNERAVQIGLFGAPSFVSGGELFWGNDRLEDAIIWHAEASARHAQHRRASP